MAPLFISNDQATLDLAMIHHFLSTQSTWARGVPMATVERAIAHSLCFGAYIDDLQVAFARVVTDCATFANLVDVFVLPPYRGRGYGKRLMQAVFEHESL